MISEGVNEIPRHVDLDRVQLLDSLTLAALRRMTPTERVEAALAAGRTARRGVARSIQRRHPEWTRSQVDRAAGWTMLRGSNPVATDDVMSDDDLVPMFGQMMRPDWAEALAATQLETLYRDAEGEYPRVPFGGESFLNPDVAVAGPCRTAARSRESCTSRFAITSSAPSAARSR